MAPDHGLLGLPLGARRPDVVFAHDLEERGAGDAHHERRGAVPDGERGEQELDRVEREVLPRGHVGHGGNPADPGDEDEDDDHGQPEGRHGKPGQAHHAEGIVEGGILADGADHARGHAQEHGDDEGEHRELHGDRDEGPDDLPRGKIVAVRLAQVSHAQVPDPVDVLHPEGPVETELLLDGHALGRVDVPSRREEDVDDIARGQAQEDEDHQRHPEQYSSRKK